MNDADLVAGDVSEDLWLLFGICFTVVVFILTGLGAYELVRWLLHLL